MRAYTTMIISLLIVMVVIVTATTDGNSPSPSSNLIAEWLSNTRYISNIDGSYRGNQSMVPSHQEFLAMYWQREPIHLHGYIYRSFLLPYVALDVMHQPWV